MFDSKDCSFDYNVFFKFMRSCRTYEEMRIKCDIHGIECIVTEVEFNEIKSNEVYIDDVIIDLNAL